MHFASKIFTRFIGAVVDGEYPRREIAHRPSTMTTGLTFYLKFIQKILTSLENFSAHTESKYRVNESTWGKSGWFFTWIVPGENRPHALNTWRLSSKERFSYSYESSNLLKRTLMSSTAVSKDETLSSFSGNEKQFTVVVSEKNRLWYTGNTRRNETELGRGEMIPIVRDAWVIL